MCVWIQLPLRRLYIVICKNSICKINARGGEEEATAHLSVIKLQFITRTESIMETQLTLSITVSDRHTHLLFLLLLLCTAVVFLQVLSLNAHCQFKDGSQLCVNGCQGWWLVQSSKPQDAGQLSDVRHNAHTQTCAHTGPLAEDYANKNKNDIVGHRGDPTHKK